MGFGLGSVGGVRVRVRVRVRVCERTAPSVLPKETLLLLLLLLQ